MKALLVLIMAALTACAPAALPAPAAPNPAHARATLTHLSMSMKSAAKQCAAHGRWLASGGQRFDFGAKERATELTEVCARRLFPMRDALYFAAAAADPWTPAASEKIACAALTTTVALVALREDFFRLGVKVPEVVADGIQLGAEAGALAPRSCDPLHPTTTATMTVDPRIAPVDFDDNAFPIQQEGVQQ